MEPVRIEYRIHLDNGRVEIFKFTLDGKGFDLIAKKIPNPPSWTELGYRQCPHCTLNPQVTPHCPLALQLHDIVERFHDTRSIDEVKLDVLTVDRRVIQKVAIQQAIASMLDLIWPICGCPKATNMKPLARFHLPVASEEETVFRVTGMYLLAQYFLSHHSNNAGIEFDGLTKIYEDYHILNKAVASRLQEVTQSDSLKNAITLLDMYSMLVPMLLEDKLAEMRGFFKAYLPEDGEVTATTDYLKKAKAFRMELLPMDEPSTSKNDILNELDAPAKAAATEEELAKEKEEEKAQQEAAAEAEKIKAIDSILNSSSLSLELEPIEKKNGDAKDAVFLMKDEDPQ